MKLSCISLLSTTKIMKTSSIILYVRIMVMDETKLDVVKKINDHELEFHNAYCFKVDVPQNGVAQAIYYDVISLEDIVSISKNHVQHPIVYIVACRMGRS